MNSTGEEEEPYQGHLRKQDWASNLGRSKPKGASPIGTCRGDQPLREWAGADASAVSGMNLGPMRV